jgi:hypothetical protein
MTTTPHLRIIDGLLHTVYEIHDDVLTDGPYAGATKVTMRRWIKTRNAWSKTKTTRYVMLSDNQLVDAPAEEVPAGQVCRHCGFGIHRPVHLGAWRTTDGNDAYCAEGLAAHHYPVTN